MASFDRETMRVSLGRIRDADPGIEAVAVVTRDGAPVAGLLVGALEEDHLAFAASSILRRCGASRAATSLGSIEVVVVHVEVGRLIVRSLANDLLLVVLTHATANLGRTLHLLSRVEEDGPAAAWAGPTAAGTEVGVAGRESEHHG